MECLNEATLNDLESQAIINYAATAKRWDIERTTLARRHQRKTTSRANADSKHRQSLTKVQEDTLLEYIDYLTTRSMPPTSQIVQNLAEEIADASLGKNWTSRFIKRHQNRITSIYLRPIDKSRVSAESKSIFEQFYALVLWFYCSFSNIF
jgi:Tc5 transposase DNA-binding domain